MPYFLITNLSANNRYGITLITVKHTLIADN